MARVADPNSKIALLSAAEAVFAEKGVEAAKVEDITRRAGLSKGAFYLHFETKETALHQICESFLAHVNAAFRPPSEEEGAPSEPGEILAFWRDKDLAIYELLWQNRATVAILQSCQGPHLYLLQAFQRRIADTSRQWIELWKKRGHFRAEIDAELASTLMVGAYDALARRMLEEPKRPPIEQWLQQAQTLFVRGLGTASFIGAHDRAQRTRSPKNGQARQPSKVRGRDSINGAPHRRRAR